jgi:hypothetical protein
VQSGAVSTLNTVTLNILASRGTFTGPWVAEVACDWIGPAKSGSTFSTAIAFAATGLSANGSLTLIGQLPGGNSTATIDCTVTNIVDDGTSVTVTVTPAAAIAIDVLASGGTQWNPAP